MLVTQLSPHGDDLGEPFDRAVPLHNPCRHDGDILRDQSRIEAIVLGQDAAGAGELTLLTEKNHPSGSTTTSRQSFDTSTSVMRNGSPVRREVWRWAAATSLGGRAVSC
jgi:hypothetical protein